MSVKPKTIPPNISVYNLDFNSELTPENKLKEILKTVKQVRVIGVKRSDFGVVPVDLPVNKNEEIGFNTYSKDLHLINVEGINFISSIKEEILQLPNVKDVRHITDDEDVHEITFLIKADSEHIESLWDLVQPIVAKNCLLLRKKTGESWYFFTEIVDNFNYSELDF